MFKRICEYTIDVGDAVDATEKDTWSSGEMQIGPGMILHLHLMTMGWTPKMWYRSGGNVVINTLMNVKSDKKTLDDLVAKLFGPDGKIGFGA